MEKDRFIGFIPVEGFKTSALFSAWFNYRRIMPGYHAEESIPLTELSIREGGYSGYKINHREWRSVLYRDAGRTIPGHSEEDALLLGTTAWITADKGERLWIPKPDDGDLYPWSSMVSGR